MTSSHPLTAPCQWFARLAAALDRRSAPRLVLLFLGAVLARGRRAVTTWIRAAGLRGQYRSSYRTVAAAGKKAETGCFFPSALRFASRIHLPSGFAYSGRRSAFITGPWISSGQRTDKPYSSK